MTIGFRIRDNQRKVAPEIVEQFRALPVANVSDCMWRMSAGQPQLRPMHGGGGMAGPALTVKSRPGDNLMLHKALDMARPGDVVVCDAGGDLTNSLFGEIMTAYAVLQGVAGIVINGAIRDADAIAAGRFPVFALGATHRGPYKDGPGEIGFPITIGGMVIEPGDLVIGDGDGILSIPMAEVEAVYEAALARQKMEAGLLAAIGAGTPDRAWVDATLRRLGCAFVE